MEALLKAAEAGRSCRLPWEAGLAVRLRLAWGRNDCRRREGEGEGVKKEKWRKVEADVVVVVVVGSVGSGGEHQEEGDVAPWMREAAVVRRVK